MSSRWALRVGRCPACGPSLLLKARDDEIGVRCMRCQATAITMSLIDVLKEAVPDLRAADAYEMSSRGPLARFLARSVRSLALSEFFDGVRPGEYRDGVRCEDAMALTFADASFDLCTSTEVFEHVADDAAGFREMARVLRPGRHLVFTVPIGDHPTGTRTRLETDGSITHLAPPEYHSDRLRGREQVLCFRNYGLDIGVKLRECGFADAKLAWPRKRWLGIARRVVVARKAG